MCVLRSKLIRIRFTFVESLATQVISSRNSAFVVCVGKLYPPKMSGTTPTKVAGSSSNSNALALIDEFEESFQVMQQWKASNKDTVDNYNTHLKNIEDYTIHF